MKNNRITLKITVTGMSVTLIIVAQLIGKMLPGGFIFFGPFSLNQLITGSLVNMILILLTLDVGLTYAITGGVLSSLMAFVLQIGPIFPQIIIFIAISNIILATVIYILGVKNEIVYNKDLMLIFVIIIAGFLKFSFLKVTVPTSLDFIKDISPLQIKTLSIMFSWPQLITATLGGILAMNIHKIFKLKNIVNN